MLLAAVAVLSLDSCVLDELYDPFPHQEHGNVAVTADWSGRGEGVDVPGKWNVVMGDYAGEETGAVHTPDRLFAPGTYALRAWNPADGISVSGSVATAAYSGSQLGWFFTHAQEVTVGDDRDHLFTAAMRQQVRLLSVVLTPTGDAVPRIAGIEATLGGVAGILDFVTGEHGAPTTVKLVFGKSREGGEWAATVRLLGVAGTPRKLTGTVTFAEGDPQPLAFESDLSESLTGFNDDKARPLTLGGTLLVTSSPSSSSPAEVTATIENWQPLDDWNIDAF